MTKTKVIVLGGQGFIGSSVCLELLDKGYEVFSFDAFIKYGKLVRPQDTHPNFHLIEIDAVKEPTRMKELILDINPTYIIHLMASIGGISYFSTFAYDLLKTNAAIDNSVFDATIALNKLANSNFKRIIVASSSMVYERTNIWPTPEDCLDKIPMAMSTYGMSKIHTEMMAKGCLQQYGINYSIARPFNSCGQHENESKCEEKVMSGKVRLLMSHVLPDLIYKSFMLGSNDQLPILGDGNQLRSYTSVLDIARGFRMVMESDKAINDAFNIATARSTSVIELAQLVWSKIHGTELKLEHCKPFEHDVQRRVPCVKKAKEVLGFEANIPLEETVDTVISWMKEQYGF